MRPSAPHSALRLNGIVGSLVEARQRGAEVRDDGLQPRLDRRRVGVAQASLDAVGDEGGQHRRSRHRRARSSPARASGRCRRCGRHARRSRGLVPTVTESMARLPTKRPFSKRFAARVGLAVGEHAVEPALQHRRRQVPPHRVLQDQQVGPVHQRQLFRHRLRQRARAGRMPLLGLDIEARRAGAVAEVLRRARRDRSPWRRGRRRRRSSPRPPAPPRRSGRGGR